MGIRAGFEQITSHEAGYSALPESEGKYELILLLLYTFVVEAQADGYTETGAQCLRVLYGPKPGLAKQAFLIDEYNALQPRSKRRLQTNARVPIPAAAVPGETERGDQQLQDPARLSADGPQHAV